MREPAHPSLDQIDLAAVLHALSDPGRLAIVAVLAEQGEYACGAFDVPVTKATLSHHFKVLRDAGVTRTRLSGRQRLVCLRRDDLDARFPGLLTAVLRAVSRGSASAASSISG